MSYDGGQRGVPNFIAYSPYMETYNELKQHFE